MKTKKSGMIKYKSNKEQSIETNGNAVKQLQMTNDKIQMSNIKYQKQKYKVVEQGADHRA